MPGDGGMGARWATGARSRRAAVLVALAAALVPLAAACGDDGRALRAPGTDLTTTSVDALATSSTVADGSTTTTLPFQLTSPAFGEGGTIPAANTCRGDDLSPPLSWVGIPANTVELALVVRDVDADGFVHWVVAGLAPAVGGLAEGMPPPGVEATNDFGRPGWAGPCPPSGTHRYEFQLLALAEPSGVTAGQTAAEAIAAIESRGIYGSAGLSGLATAG